VLLLVVLAASGRAQDGPVSPGKPPAPEAPATAPQALRPDAAPLRDWLREDWYAIRCDGVQVGWMRRALKTTGVEGKEGVVREVEALLDVAGPGAEVRSSVRMLFPAEGEQRLHSARSVLAGGGATMSRDVRRVEERMEVVTERRGERIPGAVPASPLALADELAIERVVAEAVRQAGDRPGGGRGAVVVFRALDLGTMQTTERRALVVKDEATDAGRVFTIEVFVGGRLFETLRADAAGSVLSGALGPQFVYERTTESVARKPVDHGSLESLSRVPLDGKLGPADRVKRLVVRGDARIAAALRTSSRQSVKVTDGKATVDVRRDADGDPVGEAARVAALEDAPALGIHTPAIATTAQRLLTGTSSRAVQVDRICAFVAETVRDEIVTGTLTAAEILRDARGDCTEHTTLFVALCRAAGIPARPVTGLAWMGDEKGAFQWHEWAEVALDGRWRAVDPALGRTVADAARLAADDSPAGRTALWRVRLELVTVETD
jgi:hypothetical protein